MKIAPECFECSLRQVTAVLDRMNIPRRERLKCVQEVLGLLSRVDTEMNPPSVARDFYTLLERFTGTADPYREIKKNSNDAVLKLYPTIMGRIKKEPDPLSAALCASAAGNIIDYGAMRGVTDGDIMESFETALRCGIDQSFYRVFREAVTGKRRILIIGDNAGEIVFDRILVEMLPCREPVYAVRGGPIINDVTVEDAVYTGMDTSARIICTGEVLPGVDFSASSEEFLDAASSADVIIAKGQGNLETLWDESLEGRVKQGAHVFFILKVKCGVVASMLSKKTGDTAFLYKKTGTV